MLVGLCVNNLLRSVGNGTGSYRGDLLSAIRMFEDRSDSKTTDCYQQKRNDSSSRQRLTAYDKIDS